MRKILYGILGCLLLISQSSFVNTIGDVVLVKSHCICSYGCDYIGIGSSIICCIKSDITSEIRKSSFHSTVINPVLI